MDTDICQRCFEETDTIIHKLWECQKVTDFLVYFLEKEAQWLNRTSTINMTEFLFGIDGEVGANHFWLELKLFLFYNWKGNENTATMISRFKNKLLKVIFLEKQMARGEQTYHIFVNKWEKFTEIYDFRGPDCVVI